MIKGIFLKRVTLFISLSCLIYRSLNLNYLYLKLNVMKIIIFLLVLLYSLNLQAKILWEDDQKLLQLINMINTNEIKKKFPSNVDLIYFFHNNYYFAYKYPVNKTLLEIQKSSLINPMHQILSISLPKDEYAGFGLMSPNTLDLTDPFIYQSGFLEFKIKPVSHEFDNLYVALVQEKKPRLESFVFLSKYMNPLKDNWQTITIPLSDFPKVGHTWDEENKRFIFDYVKLDQILEVKFASDTKLNKDVSFLLDEVKIRYSGLSLLTFKVIYCEDFKDFAYSYTYPVSTSTIKNTSATRYRGQNSLDIVLDPNTYSGAALGFTTINVRELLNQLNIEFWIKGKNGNEQFYVAIADSDYYDQVKCKVSVPINNYIQVTKDWQKVSIPLSDFPAEGYFWDGKNNIKVKLKTERICELIFQTNPHDNEVCEFYIDNIRIKWNKFRFNLDKIPSARYYINN